MIIDESSTLLRLGASSVSSRAPTRSSRLDRTRIEAAFDAGAFGVTLITCVGALPSGGLARNLCLVEVVADASVEFVQAIGIL